MSDKFEKWKEKIEKHDVNHATSRHQGQVDFSCVVCYQPSRIMKKEFRRFWKWYKNEIPEVISFNGKTEENFEELMKEDFNAIKRTGTEKARMRKRLVWLIESMRYEQSPRKTITELGEIICRMIVTSNKFTKKGKDARNLYEEYLSSESEGYSTDNSHNGKDDTEKTLWYDNQREMITKHNQDCEMGKESEIRDMSCRKCFPIREEISGNSNFLEFWEWYRKIMNAELFTGETVKIFN